MSVQKVSDAMLDTGINAAKLTGTLPVSMSSMTKSATDPVADTNPSGGVGTVWLNTTSGEMYSCTNATTNFNVWSNIGDGTGNITPFSPTTATGGTITTVGDFKYHTFTDSGTFAVSAAGQTIDYLVVAGGGGGAGGYYGGAGGAGGYRAIASFSPSITSYTVTIGGAGSGGPSNHLNGGVGQDSVFGPTTSSGGGYGSGYNSGDGGGAGGSGGGGAGTNYNGYGNPGPGNSGSYTPVEGYDGGSHTGAAGSGAGGGGASEVGANGNAGTTVGGTGGNGLEWLDGNTYAGGGGGGSYSGFTGGRSTGGTGGGGQGGDYSAATQAATNGTDNTGGGGGGNGYSSGTGALGGSGIVIIRYQFQI